MKTRNIILSATCLLAINLTIAKAGSSIDDKYWFVMDVSTAPESSSFRTLATSVSPVVALELTEREAKDIAARGIMIERSIEFKALGQYVEDGPAEVSDIANAGWASAAMEVPRAHALANSKGAGQRICIVDTGVDSSHPMLKGKIISATTRVPNSDGYDRNGHGSHVASLAVGPASLGAAAPSAKVISVKVLSDGGSGKSEWVASGVDECIARGAHIINMSLGSYVPSDVTLLAIRRARAAGVIVVAATGNDGGPLSYPAAFAEVVAIGAADSAGKIAGFSNRGPNISFVAPGVKILGARAGGGTVYFSGTSMASPFVAGMMALRNSRGARGISAKNLGYSRNLQGRGLVNAYQTAVNR